eukprot:3054499-Rhodomonas_salina.3
MPENASIYSSGKADTRVCIRGQLSRGASLFSRVHELHPQVGTPPGNQTAPVWTAGHTRLVGAVRLWRGSSCAGSSRPSSVSAYAPAMRCPVLTYAPARRCPVLTHCMVSLVPRIGLRACYALPISLRACYAMSGTDLPHGVAEGGLGPRQLADGISLRACYALSDTDLMYHVHHPDTDRAYGATSAERVHESLHGISLPAYYAMSGIDLA